MTKPTKAMAQVITALQAAEKDIAENVNEVHVVIAKMRTTINRASDNTEINIHIADQLNRQLSEITFCLGHVKR